MEDEVWRQINIKMTPSKFTEIKQLIKENELKDYQFFERAITSYAEELKKGGK